MEFSYTTVVEQAEETLWSAAGNRALAYLAGRGLYRETIQEARLGYIPGHYKEWRKLHGLNVPCGITIPWFADGALWGVKVRRAAGETRYEQIAGGKIVGGLYWADKLLPGWTALVAEGEFNCLIAWQEAMDIVCPVSLGSANTSLNSRWFAALVACPRILACFDADKAGTSGADRLRALSARVRLIHTPQGKDLNDFHLLKHSERDLVRNWLQGELSS